MIPVAGRGERGERGGYTMDVWREREGTKSARWSMESDAIVIES